MKWKMINIQIWGLLLVPAVSASPLSPLIWEAAEHTPFPFYAKPIFLQMMPMLPR